MLNIDYGKNQSYYIGPYIQDKDGFINLSKNQIIEHIERQNKIELANRQSMKLEKVKTNLVIITKNEYDEYIENQNKNSEGNNASTIEFREVFEKFTKNQLPHISAKWEKEDQEIELDIEI